MSSSPPQLNPMTALVPTIAAPSPITALPAQNPNNPIPIRRGLPPPCWTNDETLALIDAYKEKWYSLNRGNLRAAHWDEVAAAVTDRTSHLPASTPKTSVQCRHKIEKLRKRYRSELQKSLNHNPNAHLPSSPWIFFKIMDQMENPNRPPPPASTPTHYTAIPLSYDYSPNDDDSERRFYHRPDVAINNSNGRSSGISSSSLKFKIPNFGGKSKDNIPMGIPNLNPGSNPLNFATSMKAGLDEMRRRMDSKRKREDNDYNDSEDECVDSDNGIKEMVRAIRGLGEGYLRVEQMKMEMVKEIERARMEMELKRTEMVLDTQRRIVSAFVNGVGGDARKMKRSPNRVSSG